MFGVEIKDSNGNIIIDSENKLARLREEITVTTPSWSDSDDDHPGTYVSLSNSTSNTIFVVHQSTNYHHIISKYEKSNGEFHGFYYLTDAPSGVNITFDVYEIP